MGQFAGYNCDLIPETKSSFPKKQQRLFQAIITEGFNNNSFCFIFY